MYAMDRAVHTEHSSEPRRARRAAWRRSRPTPTSADHRADEAEETVHVAAAATDFAD